MFIKHQIQKLKFMQLFIISPQRYILYTLFLVLFVFIFSSCAGSRQLADEAVEEDLSSESQWTEYEKNAFLESCKRDATQIEGLNPDHYCNCFLEKLQYTYTIDEVLTLPDELIFELAEKCIESQP